MARMTDERIAEFLSSEDHRGTMILAVSREGKGPLCVPLAFTWSDGAFRFSTKQSREHARAFMATGRATITVHHEDYDGRQYERYVVAEGPVRLETPPPDDGSDPFLTAVLEPESLIAVVYQ
jgi:nitroimidazol reductase NimA-like FMN-containing flavoprotein (pyridoxamine 5'-phosphate oxidase superfamily)